MPLILLWGGLALLLGVWLPLTDARSGAGSFSV
jgi:hypothetical protein